MAPARSGSGLAAAVVLPSLLWLTGCPMNGFGAGSCTSDPPTTIAFSGPIRQGVMEGTTYFQGLSAQAGTMLGPSQSIEAMEVPGGATVDAHGVSWTPQAGQVGADVRFRVRSDRDLCGHAAELAWSVHVYPAIEILGFEATPAVVTSPGTAVQLLATFTGGDGVVWTPAWMPDSRAITSGVPLDVGVLDQTATFDLMVTSPAGDVAHRALTVVVQGG